MGAGFFGVETLLLFLTLSFLGEAVRFVAVFATGLGDTLSFDNFAMKLFGVTFSFSSLLFRDSVDSREWHDRHRNLKREINFGVIMLIT